MTKFLWRRGVELKDLGERLGWDWLIGLGYRIKGMAERGKIKIK